MRGGIPFDALGKRHELRFTTNALCRIQDRTGKSMKDILGELADPKMILPTYRLLIAEGAGVTLEDAGDIMDDIGMAKVDDLVAAALKLAFPPAEDAEGNAKPAA